jgi:hypothetical protein
MLANQEHDERAGLVIVGAREEGVAAFDPVNETVFQQEVQGPIYGDRGRAFPALSHPIDNFIGAKRVMTCGQRLEHVTPQWRQALPALGAQGLGVRKGICGAPGVIMIGTGKDDDHRLVLTSARTKSKFQALTAPIRIRDAITEKFIASQHDRGQRILITVL